MQVSEHVYTLRIPFQLTVSPEVKVERFVSAYVICSKEICLIDSGVASSERVIFDYIKKTGREPREIFMIILTHSHPDHIGATQAITRETGCAVAAHES